jgi:hypothetical protein
MRRYGALAGVVALGVAASLVLLAGRWQVERQDRTVEVILDGPAWQELAVREGGSPAALFAALRDRGATSVAVYERTLRNLQRQGRLAYFGGGDLLALARAEVLAPQLREMVAAGAVRPEAVYIVADPALRPWLLEAFRGILGPARARLRGGVVEVAGSREDLEDLGLGFLPADLAAARRAGLSVVLRPRNYRGLTASGLAWKLAAMQRLGPGSTLVFDGADVLGYERLVPEAARGLRAGGYRVARIEVFTVRRKQRGEDALTARIRPAVLRLFSVTPEEMATLSPPAIVEKFRRAPLERNIRLLYLRPLTNTPAGVDAVAANLDLVGRIAGSVRGLGFALGRPRPLPDLQPGLLPLVLAAAGALALGAIVLGEIARVAGVPLRPASLWLLVAAGVVLTTAAAISGDGFFLLWRRLLALGAAVAGATLAVYVPLVRGGGGPLRRGLAVLWLASGISAAAGVLVAGLLSGWSFMLAVHTFVGVKAAHVLPPLLVGFLLAFGGEVGDARSTARRIWQWLERPLRLQYAVVTVLVAIAAVMLLFRSGNFGLPVFGPEVRLRQALEDLLVARPRTKEFLIGHPALVLAAGAAALRLRAWVVPLAMVGAVGQAGLINSFSHIHTPLVLVVLRTLYALLIGSVLGAAALVVLERVVRKVVPAAAVQPAAPVADD